MLTALQSERRVLGCNEALLDDVRVVSSLVANLIDGKAPDGDSIASFSQYLLDIVHRMAFWCKVVKETKGPFAKRLFVYGSKAMYLVGCGSEGAAENIG